jgi:hypothetical protein
MNDLTLLRDAGPDAPPLAPAALRTARAALLEEIERSGTVRGRLRGRVPRRRTALRIGAGVTVAAVAWTAAVVIAAPDELGPPPGSVTLVDFDTPTFPLSLDPVPDGLTPAFDGTGAGSSIADYRDAAGENGFTVYVSDEKPDGSPDDGAPGYRLGEVDGVSIDGRDAELVQYSRTWCTDDAGVDCPRRSFAQLTWQRVDDTWVRLLGDGRYRSAERLLAVAESIVDRPQPATLRMGLAPAGWSVQFFKMGRVLTLVNDAYEQQTLTVQIPLPEDVVPPEELLSRLMGPVGPLIPVTVHGRPAQLVLLDSGYLDQQIWYLQAQFADGTTFTIQAPEAFTREQVVQMAEQVTHNP